MSTWAKLAVDEVIESATPADLTTSPPSINRWIGSRVRIRRTSRGMTQQELSKVLGIERNDLASFEAGEERVSASLLLRIAKFLDVRPDYFFQGYNEEARNAA